ncbi:MAG TPA: hypothetical protein VEA60_08405 [Allosphingosinicella sp.]|nr:hypothetical protein [Allosphingosinicella sp.]
MSITFRTIVIKAPPSGSRAPCKTGVFNLDVEVTGAADSSGGRYQVEIYDEDDLFHDYLDVVVEEAIPPGPLGKVTRVTLKCDDQCHLAGGIESSGESSAEVYAVAREQNAPHAKIVSLPIILHCVEEDENAQQTLGKRRPGRKQRTA